MCNIPTFERYNSILFEQLRYRDCAFHFIDDISCIDFCLQYAKHVDAHCHGNEQIMPGTTNNMLANFWV